MKRTITVKCDPKIVFGAIDREVEAEIKDGFAIHPTLGSDGQWTVTHVKSGLACGHYTSKTVAERRRGLFCQLAVAGVRLADMETCEALSLHPLLVEEFGKIFNRQFDEDEIKHSARVNRYVADVLACQMEATR